MIFYFIFIVLKLYYTSYITFGSLACIPLEITLLHERFTMNLTIKNIEVVYFILRSRNIWILSIRT